MHQTLAKVFGPPISFSSNEDSVKHAASAGRRERQNWIFPSLVTGIIVMMMFLFRFDSSGFFTSLPVRIILIDYLIFFISWFDSFQSARRWGLKKECIEELTLTPIPARSIGEILFAPMLSIWFRCFCVIAAVDIIFLLTNYYLAWQQGLEMLFPLLVLPFWICIFLLLPRFHSESIRLAYWLFSLTALPGVRFLQHTLTVGLQMVVIVAMLTVMGSGIAMIGVVISGIGMILSSVFGIDLDGPAATNLRNWTDIFWIPGAILGLIVIISAKMIVSKNYLDYFHRRLLMCQWWGLADSTHPDRFPKEYLQAADQIIQTERYRAQELRSRRPAGSSSSGP